MMRVDRLDGQHDMFCSSVLPNVSTPCTLLMRENKRYIVYPQKRLCCYCCDTAHGCGVPERHFLNQTTFVGYESLGDASFYKWRYESTYVLTLAADAYYYETPDLDRIPRRFANSNHTMTDFVTKSFTTAPIPSSTFALPDYCNYICPLTTICGKLQNGEAKIQVD